MHSYGPISSIIFKVGGVFQDTDFGLKTRVPFIMADWTGTRGCVSPVYLLEVLQAREMAQ